MKAQLKAESNAEMDEWESVPNTMRLTGLARPTVLGLGLRGGLTIRQIGGRLLVSKQSIREYEAHRASGSSKAA